MPEEQRTVTQRLCDVAAEIGDIAPTGKDRFKNPALSIGDVDRVLRPLFAKHGLVDLWRMKGLEKIGTEWLVRCSVIIRGSTGDDKLVSECIDIGSSPTAAVSFCRKNFYRSLLHITDSDESTGSPAVDDSGRTYGATPAVRELPLAPTLPPLDICPICKEMGLTTISKKPPVFKETPQGSMCNGWDSKKEIYVKHRPAVEVPA